MNKESKGVLNKPLGQKSKAVLLVLLIVAALVGLYIYNQYFTPPNTAPEIIYVYPGTQNYISDSSISALKYNKLIAGITDKDGDPLVVSFWLKEGNAWRGLVMFQGGNGTYIYNLPTPYLAMPPRTTPISWRIDVFDGHNMTSKVVDF